MASSTNASVRDEIQNACNKRYAAYLKLDVKDYMAEYAQDWIGHSLRGKTEKYADRYNTLSRYFSRIRKTITLPLSSSSWSLNDTIEIVSVKGNQAFVTENSKYIRTYKNRFTNRPYVENHRSILRETWRRQNNQWVMAEENVIVETMTLTLKQ